MCGDRSKSAFEGKDYHVCLANYALKNAPRSAKTTIVSALLRHGLMSRLELSEWTSISPGAITEITRELLNQGLIIETGAGSTIAKRRGRPSVQLALSPSHAYFVGLSLAEDRTVLTLIDMQGQVLSSEETAECTSEGELSQLVSNSYRRLLARSKADPQRVGGIGVSVAGIVDAQAGLCLYSVGLDWRDVPVASMVAEATGVPAWIDNDANALAVGEKIFGRAREMDDLTAVMLGSTIGAAHYIHGRLYRGSNSGAGEMGHIIVDPSGRLCRCGRIGCLDTVVGGFAIRQAALALGLKVSKMRDLEEFAILGDVNAFRLLQEAGKALGATIAALVHFNNPRAVLFIDMEGFGPGVFRTATRQAVENGILPRLLGATEIAFVDGTSMLLPRSAASIALFNYLMAIQ
ncbi:ROK family transcriptional regulator [Silvibacterium sp.]|uniref:ROK family transcriptional regulator n=1 Tax=Silvibacterium sp. TaxID=1964179 RepID=UPI0039E5F4A8